MEWRPMTSEALASLLEETKGKIGSEPEGSLSWSAADDHVTVTSARGSHIAALLRRCGSVATEWTALRYEDGSAEWAVRIPVVYFRGFDMAFRNVDDRDESTPESLERLRSLREGK